MIGLLCASAALAGVDDKVADPVAVSAKLQESGSARLIVSFHLDTYAALRAASISAKKAVVGSAGASSSQATSSQAASAQAEQALAAAIQTGVAQALGAVSGGSVELVRTFKTIPAALVRADNAGLSALEALDQVAYIQLDKLRALARPVATQSVPEPPTLEESIPLIGADRAWDQGYTGEGWHVAILDTGIRRTHEFFAGKDIVEACYSSRTEENPNARLCPNGEDSQTGKGAAALFDSSNGGYDHGVHVAGIAAGHKADDSLNGVAKNADIIAVNVFSDDLTDDEGNPEVLSFDSDAIRGLEHIYSLQGTYNIAAVNISIGSDEYTENCDAEGGAYKQAVDTLREVGIATATAAGNDSYCNAVNGPACLSSTIAVGASDKSDVKADFSNWQKDLVQLFAPGVEITSSTGDSDTSYAAWDGTSMATPFVAGAWTVLKQKMPNASVDEILNALTQTAKLVTFDTCDNPEDVYQRISVCDALETLQPVAATESDILWNNTETGRNAVWYMNGAQYQGFDMLQSTASGWYVVATGDFDKDGDSDILWHRSGSQKSAIWYMNGKDLGPWTMLADTAAVWVPVGVADCNQDGNVDIYWQNQTTNRIAIWYMDNAELQEFVYSESSQELPWAIVGVEDFNADGVPDLLWRNAETGANEIWTADASGIAWASKQALTDAATDWKVAGTGDFNGDGFGDILWRKPVNGANCVWYLSHDADAFELSEFVFINSISSPWESQAVGDF